MAGSNKGQRRAKTRRAARRKREQKKLGIECPIIRRHKIGPQPIRRKKKKKKKRKLKSKRSRHSGNVTEYMAKQRRRDRDGS